MDKLNITLVQSNLEWQQAAANRDILAGMLEQAKVDTDLIILHRRGLARGYRHLDADHGGQLRCRRVRQCRRHR